MSLSTRRVWIEIDYANNTDTAVKVTLHTESVDWNCLARRQQKSENVTLHTESVDWNISNNIHCCCYPKSLSTRRVWIEISVIFFVTANNIVTLHTESVDWNRAVPACWVCCIKALSTRRVWIEIKNCPLSTKYAWVTLHTESVDWNDSHCFSLHKGVRHSPHGECGLKSIHYIRSSPGYRQVTLHTESVDWNL